MTALQKPNAQERLNDRIEKSLQSRFMRAQEMNDEEAKAEAMRLYLLFQKNVEETLVKNLIPEMPKP